jgi:NAD(P)-dependent dehydrogenase (short-subunit alcohol dehydrogenase family)
MLSGIRRRSNTDALLWPEVEIGHDGHGNAQGAFREGNVPLASIHSLMAFPGDLAYPVAKAELVGFIRRIATDSAPTIRGHALAPGAIDSPALKAAPPEERRCIEKLARFNPVGTVHEGARAARFFLSEASAFMIGTMMAMPSCWTAGWRVQQP